MPSISLRVNLFLPCFSPSPTDPHKGSPETDETGGGFSRIRHYPVGPGSPRVTRGDDDGYEVGSGTQPRPVGDETSPSPLSLFSFHWGRKGSRMATFFTVPLRLFFNRSFISHRTRARHSGSVSYGPLPPTPVPVLWRRKPQTSKVDRPADCLTTKNYPPSQKPFPPCTYCSQTRGVSVVVTPGNWIKGVSEKPGVFAHWGE